MRPLLEHRPRSIAIVHLRTGLGDLLCIVPALRALRAPLPEAHVVLVSFPEMALVVDRMRAWIDELLPFPGYAGIPERPPREDASSRSSPRPGLGTLTWPSRCTGPILPRTK